MARLISSVFPVLMNESIVSKLHSEGILTVYDFMLQKCDALMRKTGLTFKEIEEIREYFSTQFGWEITYPGDLFERESKQKILTGIKNLDALLEGGLGCGTIYEICGSSSAGKSQLCHWLSMHATSNGSAVVHYIDASRNFCASRIQMMLESRHCDDGMIGYVMSNIKVYQICKIYELFNILYSLSKSPDKEQSKSSKRLIIVDSLSVLCAIVSNRDLNPLLCNVAVMCRDIINHSQVVVLIVNTVRSQQAGLFLSKETENNFVLQIKPSLGNYWLNVPNVRLLMTQKENGRRKIAVWNSQELVDEKSCIVQIKDEGVFQI
ncbi:uncharacterized protein LOC131672256 [Phymastichus coffea]|uniref:uncharacterized protein LOC131672256 n=1 Tax=Phymastichus coffea TaxID=108790 RepID=UPI00273A76E4|nr:uncharacterized protein LOC131672256 [Phymastichus coffea]XP_058805350.1 uncharacterized protein LOC131672256 [Phymastichus coffea]XP_058805351.1 uncharacterized protein LOC131672256 [Phymastichus coffea]XP_058805352.1 uncharacterized protein LOC131672256 [Phymastichus coffea]XP_058805353.1 uncharacterized protein LOC131672256 [Phymastichus coffea]